MGPLDFHQPWCSRSDWPVKLFPPLDSVPSIQLDGATCAAAHDRCYLVVSFGSPLVVVFSLVFVNRGSQAKKTQVFFSKRSLNEGSTGENTPPEI